MKDSRKISFLLISTLFLLATVHPCRAEESAKPPNPATPPAAQSPSGMSLISANGFSCSMVEGQTQCQGKFMEVDKDLVFGARGMGEITLRLKKGDKLYSYFSRNGCLCEDGKSETACQNALGKKEKFKGDKRQSQASAFCATKK